MNEKFASPWKIFASVRKSENGRCVKYLMNYKILLSVKNEFYELIKT